QRRARGALGEIRPEPEVPGAQLAPAGGRRRNDRPVRAGDRDEADDEDPPHVANSELTESWTPRDSHRCRARKGVKDQGAHDTPRTQARGRPPAPQGALALLQP